MKKDLRIAFLGTPDFAAASLEAIHHAGFNVVVVVTTPDKPAGRGNRLKVSPVKQTALKLRLPVLQPVKLKSPDFIEEYKAFGVNLGVVVAFRMLPEIVWSLPEFGTFNLHASLLPQYRGAAPINRAIMNGEHETGVTTFFLKQEIDTGDIILAEKVAIGHDETAGELHDKLMVKGAQLVVETTKLIRDGDIEPKPQEEISFDKSTLKAAPKIFKEDCIINWNKPGEEIYNQIRGLSPIPGAYSYLENDDSSPIVFKVYSCRFKFSMHVNIPGIIETDGKSFFSVTVTDGIIFIENLQMQGKKRMDIKSFLNGFNLLSGWRIPDKMEN